MYVKSMIKENKNLGSLVLTCKLIYVNMRKIFPPLLHICCLSGYKKKKYLVNVSVVLFLKYSFLRLSRDKYTSVSEVSSIKCEAGVVRVLTRLRLARY